MAGVGDYDVLPFAGPVQNPPPAEVVRGNDETLRAKFVDHQNDTVAHIQAGPIASRPATADEGSVWVSTDTGAVLISVYTGGAWVDASYPSSSSGDFIITES